jgi:hypothetical protein
MTGWSRFTHFTVLCELLPASIPSLVLCLNVIERRKLNLRVIYANVVRLLNLQTRVLIQTIDVVYKECDGDLQKFIKVSPRIGKNVCFCFDAFFLSW